MTHIVQKTRRAFPMWAKAVVAAAVVAGALYLAARPDGYAADKVEPAPKADASPLDFVPADGAAVVSVRFADLWNHAALKAARERVMKEVPDFVEHFTKELGVAPDEVERITGFTPSLPPAWAVFVTTVKPYDLKKVAAVLAPDAKEEKVNDRTVMVGPEGTAVAFLTDRTYVRGEAGEVRRLAGRAPGGKEGPLTPALREAAGKHLVVAGLDGEALAKTAPAELPPDAAAFKPLLKATNAVLTEDLGDELKADLRVTFAGEADAKHGEEAVNAALDLARAAVVKGLGQMEELHKTDKALADVVPLVKDIQAALRAAKVERNGSTVEVAASMKFDPEKMGVALLDGVQKVRNAAARMNSLNNLKQLVLAMHFYHDANGRFPASAVCDKNGKPLLSWRVAILPYIEEAPLYKEFHLDEPWDSDHNKKLLEKMPKVFAAATQDEKELKDHKTRYQGFAGKGAFFEGVKGITLADITDGTSNTIMLVEAAKAAPWTKPEDVPFDEGKLLPKVGGLFDGIFNAAMCDGSVRSFPTTMKEETLRALLTRNGGEVIEDIDK
jgi:Protein of unknown function (DUF1559)